MATNQYKKSTPSASPVLPVLRRFRILLIGLFLAVVAVVAWIADGPGPMFSRQAGPRDIEGIWRFDAEAFNEAMTSIAAGLPGDEADLYKKRMAKLVLAYKGLCYTFKADRYELTREGKTVEVPCTYTPVNATMLVVESTAKTAPGPVTLSLEKAANRLHVIDLNPEMAVPLKRE